MGRLVVASAGIGIAWPHLTTAAMSSAEGSGEADAAAASITPVQLIATSLGSALAGTLVNLSGLDSTPSSAARSATVLYAVFAALVLLETPTARRVAATLRPYTTTPTTATRTSS